MARRTGTGTDTGKHRLELVLDTGTVEALDRARGRTPRATFVKRALEAAMSGDNQAANTGPSAEADGRGGHQHTGSTPARSAPSTARVASRPATPPRAPAARRHLPTCKCAICKPPKAKA